MKWSVVGLLGLGVVAALCAAVLVAGLSGQRMNASTLNEEKDAEITVLVAAKPLPAMAIIDSTSVKSMTMMRSKAPMQSMGSMTDVIGKVLAVPVVEGQPLARSLFSNDAAKQLAAVLAPGKRAIGISVNSHAALEGLIYPGSMVDVLVTLKPNNGEMKEPVSVTLLEGIEVLAIDRTSVISPDGEKHDAEAPKSTGGRVTLLVDTQQAKLLQLAMEQGSLTLALRNPLDKGHAEQTVVRMSSLFAGQASDLPSEAQTASAHGEGAPTTGPTGLQWETTVLRGGASETLYFSIPKEESHRKGKSGI
jgi:pilus assembly protein CpaB